MQVGKKLGAYEVIAKLGEGGMGEVFRARDTKLNRDVALKVLPDSFAGDRDRLARFTREAQTLAALNHPHIGAIYGLEDADGVRALVLELVHGETLADRIARGAFGCVMYEMLSGHPAFERETLTDTLAAILEREPDWAALPPSAPHNVRRLLARCLEKDPRRRLRDIADAPM